ncbi:hypothetical protein AB4Z40_02355 [Bosea sp. 2YAB26]|uniref:hypothetical protein n=1 Tax=Bosea sp. 2YAB26 TaxID=3237478 RepID=UPI003F934F2F
MKLPAAGLRGGTALRLAVLVVFLARAGFGSFVSFRMRAVERAALLFAARVALNSDRKGFLRRRSPAGRFQLRMRAQPFTARNDPALQHCF